MRRFMGAIAVALVLLGGVAFLQRSMTQSVDFSLSRDVEEHGAQHEDDQDSVYELYVTTTFDAVDDPFAIKLDQEAGTPRVLIRHLDEVLLLWNDDVRSGERIAATNLHLMGETIDVYVEASPSADDLQKSCALRVVVEKAGVPCDDQTIWSSGDGSKISARLTLSLEPKLQKLDRGL